MDVALLSLSLAGFGVSVAAPKPSFFENAVVSSVVKEISNLTGQELVIFRKARPGQISHWKQDHVTFIACFRSSAIKCVFAWLR